MTQLISVDVSGELAWYPYLSFIIQMDSLQCYNTLFFVVVVVVVLIISIILKCSCSHVLSLLEL